MRINIGKPVTDVVTGAGLFLPVKERHCGTSEMLVPVEIDLEKNTIALTIELATK